MAPGTPPAPLSLQMQVFAAHTQPRQHLGESVLLVGQQGRWPSSGAAGPFASDMTRHVPGLRWGHGSNDKGGETHQEHSHGLLAACVGRCDACWHPLCLSLRAAGPGGAVTPREGPLHLPGALKLAPHDPFPKPN